MIEVVLVDETSADFEVVVDLYYLWDEHQGQPPWRERGQYPPEARAIAEALWKGASFVTSESTAETVVLTT